MKGLSPHFPASGGVGNLTHFSISLCSSHDLGPKLTSFIFASSLLPLLYSLPTFPCPGWIHWQILHSGITRQEVEFSFLFPNTCPLSRVVCVCVCVCACMSIEAARKKEIRTHFMSHVNPQETKLHAHSFTLTFAHCYGGFPGGSDGKESTCNAGELGLVPGLVKIPWRRTWQPTPVFLPGEAHGQRSLAGCSP